MEKETYNALHYILSYVERDMMYTNEREEAEMSVALEIAREWLSGYKQEELPIIKA